MARRAPPQCQLRRQGPPALRGPAPTHLKSQGVGRSVKTTATDDFSPQHLSTTLPHSGSVANAVRAAYHARSGWRTHGLPPQVGTVTADTPLSASPRSPVPSRSPRSPPRAAPVPRRRLLRPCGGGWSRRGRRAVRPQRGAPRQRDMPRFGHLRTLALPAHLPALNAQLHEWRRPLAASTCNHRRHALTNLVRVLYGRRASFDLLDLVRFAPPPPKPRWVDRRHIADVLAQIPADSVTRVRLELMHWTGMRPSQMGRLRAEDFRLDEPIPYVAGPARKGRPDRGRPAGTGGSRHRPRLPRRRSLRPVAAKQRQPSARRRRPPRRPSRVHHLPDPPRRSRPACGRPGID